MKKKKWIFFELSLTISKKTCKRKTIRQEYRIFFYEQRIARVTKNEPFPQITKMRPKLQDSD